MRGHIRKRGSKWAAVLFLGFDELTGKRKYKWFSGFDTKKAAEKALTEKAQEVNTGTYSDPTKETLGNYIEQWLKDKSAQLRPGTMRAYSWLIRCHIVPNLGRIELSKLRPQHLQSLYTKLRQGDKPLSNRSVQFAHTILHGALDRAVKWGLVPRNVADAVDAPRPDKSKGTTWTLEQAMSFLKVNQNEEERYWIGFFIAIMTGMRKGEILALRWNDIDFHNGYARVNQTLSWVKGYPIFHEPKTDRSRRSVALSQNVLDELRRHRTNQAKSNLMFGYPTKDDGLIIARLDGSPMNPRTFDDAWYRSMRRADVPHIRFHDLRHTHASLLLQQGVHPKIVSERLGHSTINITLDTYSHVLPGLQKQAADDFEEAIEKVRKNTLSK